MDYLFRRSVIDEEDYANFWDRYWRGNATARRELVKEYSQQALEFGGPVVGVVTKNRRDAYVQAQQLGGRVVRRNRFGQFSKRGHYFQAIKKAKRK